MQNSQKKSQKFKKGPLMIAIGFLAVSLLGLFLTYKEINSNEMVSNTTYGEWLNEDLRRDAIRSLERSIKDIEEERKEVGTHFAEKDNVVPLLDTLERLAVLAGGEAEVKSVDISKDAAELIVSLQIEGSFEANYKFIKLLENAPYELEIQSFNIQKLGGEEGAVEKWEGTFTLRLLSFVK